MLFRRWRPPERNEARLCPASKRTRVKEGDEKKKNRRGGRKVLLIIIQEEVRTVRGLTSELQKGGKTSLGEMEGT